MADDAKLIVELEDKTPQQAGAVAGFVGFSPETGIVSGLSNVHPFVSVAAGAMSAIIEGMQALKGITLDMAEELRPYSGQVATAFALNERDRINMLIERDAKIGSDIAQMVRLQGQLDVTWGEFKTQFFLAIAPALTKGVEYLSQIAGRAAQASKEAEEVGGYWQAFLIGWAGVLEKFGVLTEADLQIIVENAWREADKGRKEGIKDILGELNQFMTSDDTIPEPIPFPSRNIPNGGAF